MSVIVADNLSKTFRVARKQPGLAGSLRHFFRRQYKHIDAVKSISFTIEPGEVVGFLGPNGAGKTTALKMLTGLVHPSAGRVEVLGHTPFKRQHDFLRQITLVMGNKQQLIWDLPALDSLRINAAVYGVADVEFHRRLAELCEMLSITDELNQPVRKLSLGQRMKAELLASLLHHPRVLFLDEPTLGLDVNAQAAVRSFLQQYNQRFGATLLLTSHYMADITALCPRVLLIHQGALIYDDKLARLVDRFSPYREVKIELNDSVENVDWSRFGEVESASGRIVRLIVLREKLTRVVDQMLDEFDVHDLTVTDPPLEQIIGRLFDQGVVDTPNTAAVVEPMSP